MLRQRLVRSRIRDGVAPPPFPTTLLTNMKRRREGGVFLVSSLLDPISFGDCLSLESFTFTLITRLYTIWSQFLLAGL
jgi:hypothetical protein